MSYFEKWKKVEAESSAGEFRIIRIDDSLVDLYLGLSKNHNRCVILKLSSDTQCKLPNSIKDNLKLELYGKENYLVLQLLNADFNDVFDELIKSIHQEIKKATDEAEVLSSFMSRYYKWSSFFSNKSVELSKSELIGLLGELYYLFETLTKLDNDSDVNKIQSSWVGIYGALHDFEFDNKTVEVKTTLYSKREITISSKHQLESQVDKHLELVTYTIEEDYSTNSLSLGSVLARIKECVEKNNGDFSITLDALNQKSLGLNNIKSYDNHRFLVLIKNLYACEHEMFPKLTPQNTSSKIKKIEYVLNTDEIKEFISKTVSYHNEN